MPSSKAKPVWKVNPQPQSTQYINSVAISSNGAIVVGGTYFFDYSKSANNHSASQPATVGTFAYNAKGKLQWKDLIQASEGIYWAAVSNDGAWAASCGLQSPGKGFIFAYNAATGAKGLTYNPPVRANMVALSGNGAYLAAAADGVYLFSRTGSTWSAPKKIPCATGDTVVSLGISQSGNWIVAGTYLGLVMLISNTGGVLGAPGSWQLAGGSIHWVAISGDGSTFAAAGTTAKVYCFNTASFVGSPAPAWTGPLTGCAGCRSVALSGNGSSVAAVGNSSTTGKAFLFSNQGTSGTLQWSKATLRNPNSVSLDSLGKFVALADGYPDGAQGDYYLFNNAGVQQWSYKTSNMSWPIQISSDGSATAAGSDDSFIYYFS